MTEEMTDKKKTMRIIGGKFRGRKIQDPHLKTTRPTKDRIREAVFNMIAAELPGARVLDLFAGSGAYGLEALSRGAKEAVFAEKNPLCADTIKKNIQSLKLDDCAEVLSGDAFAAIISFGEKKEKFDLVFSDPPYAAGMTKKVLLMIYQYDILNPTGLLILEHTRSEGLPELTRGVSVIKQRTYGDISISIFMKRHGKKSGLSRDF
ncbi:MAG: 16S rRNA (guanine(966)-N(2))-methyltransferase RsmD [Candidatus Omnitrophota bacterium]